MWGLSKLLGRLLKLGYWLLVKRFLLHALLIVLTLTCVTRVVAFHKGGVATCAVCHTMHNSQNGMPVNPAPDNNYLLVWNSATDLCLSCHATDNGSVWANGALTPAAEQGSGNFIFNSAANINDAPNGLTYPLVGSHGIHNCAAPSQNAGPDPIHATAPGGSFPSSSLGCTSCHDPHGNENFRMLRGAGPLPGGETTFIYDAPLGEGIPLIGAGESRTLHTAYQSGWTNWCANCHGLFHEEAVTGFAHPVDEHFDTEIISSYAHYEGSGNPTGGDPLTSYLPQVPFEDPGMMTTTTSGPTMSSRISCITCHRAHGSSAVDLGRWDFRVNNMRLDGFPSGSYPISSPFGIGTIERQLCNKCHEPDTRTHGMTQACIECHREEVLKVKQPNLPTLKRR